MNTMIAELQWEPREVLRFVQGGEDVVLTDSSKPAARIIPYIDTITVTPADARASGELSDEEIIAAVWEERGIAADHLDPR